jgi:hypothetical protein
MSLLTTPLVSIPSFYREMVQVVANAGTENTTHDQLELLRVLSTADSMVAQGRSSHRGREPCSAVTLALLELCWADGFATQVRTKSVVVYCVYF